MYHIKIDSNEQRIVNTSKCALLLKLKSKLHDFVEDGILLTIQEVTPWLNSYVVTEHKLYESQVRNLSSTEFKRNVSQINMPFNNKDFNQCARRNTMNNNI